MKYGFDSEKTNRFPSMVQISITNMCDMSCSMCPHIEFVKQKSFRSQYLDMDLYRRIADEVGENRGTIRLLGWGEALLHPDLVEMVEYAKLAGVEFVTLISNGRQLTKEKSEGLIKAGLDVLEVSLDAYTESTYRAIRRNRFFNTIKDNIFTFLGLRDELGGNTFVAVGIIKQPKAETELEDFKKYWSQIVDDVVVRRYRDFKGYVNEEIETPSTREPCRCLWARFNITPEGKVTVCYDDWQSQYIIADLHSTDMPIEKIWHSETFEQHRMAHLEGRAFGLCKDCKDWIASSWSQPYEVLLEKVRVWQHERTVVRKTK